METLSALLALCEGDPLLTGGFPSQGAGNVVFGIFAHANLNKWLNKPTLPVIWNAMTLIVTSLFVEIIFGSLGHPHETGI